MSFEHLEFAQDWERIHDYIVGYGIPLTCNERAGKQHYLFKSFRIRDLKGKLTQKCFLRQMPSSGKFYSSEVSFVTIFIEQQKLSNPGMW